MNILQVNLDASTKELNALLDALSEWFKITNDETLKLTIISLSTSIEIEIEYRKNT